MNGLLDGLPKSIRLGPFDIALIVKDKISDDDDAGIYHNGISIELRGDQFNAMFAVDTVLHEISHGLYRAAGLDKKSSEENIVTAMATGWTQVFRDNPALLTWLYQMIPPAP